MKKAVSFKWVKPVFEKAKVILPDGKEGAVEFSTPATTENYAGVVKQSSTRRVSGWWSVPTITGTTTTNRPAYTAQWVGLGGMDPSEPLLQTGTFEEISSTGTVTNRVWYEVIGTNLNSAAVYLTSIPSSPGDAFFGELSYSTSGSSSILTVTITNNTQGIGTSFCPQNITTWPNAFSHSDWISERPRINGSHNVNLAKGDVYFSSAKWASTATGTLAYVTESPTSTLKLSMTRVGNPSVKLAVPSLINSTGSFDVIWQAYN